MPRSAKTALLLLLLAPFALTEQVQKLQQGKRAINDFAGVVTEEDQRQLETISDSVWSTQHARITIVTINSLEGQTIETFATDLFKQWGIGGQDNRGVLILLAINDRKDRVEVGYGLEPILPDVKVGGFGREIVPALKQKHYSHALVTLSTRVAQTIQSGPAIQPKDSMASQLKDRIPLLLLFVTPLLVIHVAVSILSKGRTPEPSVWAFPMLVILAAGLIWMMFYDPLTWWHPSPFLSLDLWQANGHAALGGYLLLAFFCLVGLIIFLSFLRKMLIACGYKNQGVLNWLPRRAPSRSSSLSSSSDSGSGGGSSGGGGASGSW